MDRHCFGMDGLVSNLIRPVTVGYMYMMKLNHLVADKMQRRGQQDRTAWSRSNRWAERRSSAAQRFGEMEVWALEAHGAGIYVTGDADGEIGRCKRPWEDVQEHNYRKPSNGCGNSGVVQGTAARTTVSGT